MNISMKPVCTSRVFDSSFKSQQCSFKGIDTFVYDFFEPSSPKPFEQEDVFRLYSSEGFEDFAKAHPEIVEPIKDEIVHFRMCGLKMDLDLIKRQNDKFSGDNVYKKFIENTNDKLGIDLLKTPTYYRYIGNSEFEKLMNGETLEPKFFSSFFDITTDPEYSIPSGYRVAFKSEGSFAKIPGTLWGEKGEIGLRNQDDYRYVLNKSYSIDDVERVEKVVGYDYSIQKRKFETVWSA